MNVKDKDLLTNDLDALDAYLMVMPNTKVLRLSKAAYKRVRTHLIEEGKADKGDKIYYYKNAQITDKGY